jgi:hypothetical protein
MPSKPPGCGSSRPSRNQVSLAASDRNCETRSRFELQGRADFVDWSRGRDG